MNVTAGDRGEKGKGVSLPLTLCLPSKGTSSFPLVLLAGGWLCFSLYFLLYDFIHVQNNFKEAVMIGFFKLNLPILPD